MSSFGSRFSDRLLLNADHDEHRTVIDPTDARQGSGRLANFRVLISSLVVLTILGIGLLATFFIATPPSMDGPPSGAAIDPAPAQTTTSPGTSQQP